VQTRDELGSARQVAEKRGCVGDYRDVIRELKRSEIRTTS
jgi:hypothetical protein